MKVKFNPGPSKLMVVKILKEELHIGLKEAKDMADAKEFECSEAMYPSVKKKLEMGGARDFYKAD